MKFTEFGLDERLLEGIDSMGYENATPVQEQVIVPILQGKDIIASAQTGTGKTAAFLLPVINKIITEPHDAHLINAVVIVPTRELAVQIAQTMEGLSYFTDVSSIAVYGGSDGTSFTTEKKALSSGVDMVICTPGRMIAHLNMGYVRMEAVKYLILDEADRMLDMGFHDDIMKIISFLPKQRQNLLFSATMPMKMRELARKILHHPLEINIAISKPPEQIVQEAFILYEPQKIPLVKDILRRKDFQSVIIFCSRKSNVKQLSGELRRSKFSIGEIHSDLEQDAREQVLQDFRNKKLKILVATDILSRGIDIEEIDLVINYDVPNDGEDYVHRIGRTARAASTGTAYTFVTEAEQHKFAQIENLLGAPVTKAAVPEQFGPTPEYNPRKSRPSGGGSRRQGGRPGGRPGARQASGRNGHGGHSGARKPRP
ncbi:MAG: DEAD/DEAH box helicase [Chitinophagaceae bacterium]|nr:DEAD/DEAH box helicase [Chitinophagaceae bacterium]MEA3427375.1 DEAD/DEAH box helicase [Bacteroidota bacterium]MCA6453204.1 DEAD/DEAH box helicase [Chitinophagaceae bacterium]MCA6454628.1 DEAD/DEAH box helicase [Chitinophagaceae bacterium]MCA6458343.1 DEAD/DEAH box helicase [Chitinophagaceae bacterium]